MFSWMQTRLSRSVLVVALMVAALPVAGVVAGTTKASAVTVGGSCPGAPTQLANASFESPGFPSNQYRIISDSKVPGWSTTAPTGNIEIWTTAYQGVYAFDQFQFAELNADAAGALYQDVPTTPGQTLVWSLHHRARTGPDTMYVDIGVPGTTLGRQATLTDNIAAGWVGHSGVYVVPAGQTITRFAFVSGPTGSGNLTVGNFLDDISFGTPSCVVASKSVSPVGAVNAGQILTYTVSLSNQGGSATKDLVMSDVLPQNVTYVAGSAGPGSSYDAGTRTLTVRPVGTAGTAGVLESGKATQVTFQVSVDNAAGGTTILNTGTVTETDGLGNVATIATNTTSTPVDQSADLSLVKSFSPNEVTTNAPATMTLQVTNHGPDAAANVVVSDTIPTGLILGALPSGCVGTTLVTCTASSLANQAQASFSIPVSSAATNTVIKNTASVASETFDPKSDNNTATAVISVSPTAASLAISKTVVGPTTISAGAPVRYQIDVTNTSPPSTPVSSIVVTDTIPAGFTATCPVSAAIQNCSIANSLITMSLSGLASGEIASFVLDETSDPSMATPFSAIDTATVNGTDQFSAPVPQAQDQQTVSVINDPELLLSKTVINTPAAGQPLTYELTLVSLGPSTSKNTVLTDELPSNLDASTLSTIALPSGCALASYTITCTIGDLAPNTPMTFSYSVQLPGAGGTFVNQAKAVNDSPFDTGWVQVVTQVAAEADLHVTKSVTPTSASVGGLVTYTLGVSNQGYGTATGVVVDDNMYQNGLDVVSTTAPAGSWNPTTATWTVGTLLPGESRSVQVTARVMRSGVLANTLLATASDPLGTLPSKSATAYVNAIALATTGFSFGTFLEGSGLSLFLGVSVLMLGVVKRRRDGAE